MDVTGGEMVGRLLEDLHDVGVRFTLARVRTSVQETLRRLGLDEKIGPENVFLTVQQAADDFAAASREDADRPTPPPPSSRPQPGTGAGDEPTTR
jgi:SulP family sulfate permease